MAEDEIEYESDPEEAKLSLKLRRREASDDEEEREGGAEKPRRRIDDDSDVESEGAVAEYEDELEEEYDLAEEYLEEEEEGGYDESVRDGDEVVSVERAKEGGDEGVVGAEMTGEKMGVNDKVGGIDGEDNKVADGGHEEEEKKEAEPFAVPTAGAFYMHDDRFRDNAGGRHRRTLGGRRLWESKDERKWGHDKFEELTVQERHREEHRRGSRGRYRGRGRQRGSDRGYAQGGRPKEYTSNSTQNNNNQSNPPKSVRGRGPRRYQSSFKNNNDAPIAQNKQPGKYIEKHSHANPRRTSESVSSEKPDVVQPRKQVASNLNIASPPFYPTSSSTNDSSVPLKRDVRAGTTNRNGQKSAGDENFTVAQSTAAMRGKNIVSSMNNLYIDDSSSAITGKSLNTMQMPLSASSSTNPIQPLRSQGRGHASLTQMAYLPAISNQVNRNLGQSRPQSSLQPSVQQFTQRLPQAFSPPKAVGTANTFDTGEVESASELNQNKTALAAKGKGNQQGSVKGSFLYGGGQVMGATGGMSSGHGDQNFPAFLPVMQFGGQRPGGIGVPAVGMAFPGYVGQPQLGGSSEMTWLPVLAGAAGALGASYCPPYITVDGSFNPRPSGQTSSVAVASRENNVAKVNNDWKPAQRPELANEDFGQRQKNPRRYTEMKFDQ